MTKVTEAVDQIEQWLKKTGTKESRLGLLACANARAIDGIRSGNGTVKNLNKVLQFIEANPDGEK